MSRITVETTVMAELHKVWECWTVPNHIVNWNFASKDWHCPWAKNDLREGGKFSSRMESVDGKMGFDFEGIYDEVHEGRKIAYSLADGRRVEILFEKNGDSTLVTETFDPENENPLEMQRAGWQAILDHFKKYTEKLTNKTYQDENNDL
ncbi:MAG TPA: hypothetical protein DCX54_09790 [Flavobacteriales bacterium]|nr:hypothetical protein [Flavobacteriales bacterium]